MWIVAIDIAGDFDVCFIPWMTMAELDALPANCPEFGENGWFAEDFANPNIYTDVFVFGSRW